MDFVERKEYIDKIKPFINKPVIKVITGMRRVGKSTFLKIISEKILKDIEESNKIYLNFETLELLKIKTDIELVEYLTPLLKDKKDKVYMFFDEIQLVKNWERVINALRVDDNYDIYITGSNSSLMSSKISTLLSGRYIQIEIQPFNFREFLKLYSDKNLVYEELFKKYINIGGIPFLKYFDLDENSCAKYLQDLYNTVIVKDVIEYNKVRDVDMFNRILTYVFENIGQTFSSRSIQKFLKNENRNISVDTILNYLEYAKSAYIIKKVPRYDVVGKKILSVDEKYFITDHGLRYAKGFSNEKNIERILENIVYIELLSRGYKVNIGRVNDKEIDFIAVKGDKKEYYQVSYLLETEETRNREFGVYQKVEDNYPKYVLSMDKINFSQNGIIHLNIVQFLCERSIN
ncbi:ATP-binding protein [Sneathia sanguinegens]|uniref:ATP-binding protein n=1 Tax=Sneathia sanguinegens TaxID=40543 RepID=A0ABT7HKC5_9FUSO|nr:ATP-binding protein [Sneathia sanguinegens]MDK9580988.1 ATP-binding protein [Sneathia sanguinegens]